MTVLAWFLWRRWLFMVYVKELLSRGYRPWCEQNLTHVFHNRDQYSCRKHPVIYNDMCRIVRGMK